MIVNSIKTGLTSQNIYQNRLLDQHKNNVDASSVRSIAFKGTDTRVAEAYAAPQIDTSAIKAKNIWKQVAESDNIVILAHKFADSDAVTSGLTLTNVINEKFPDKKVTFYVPGGYPSMLKSVPSIEKVSKIPPKGEIGLAISVDSNEQHMDGIDVYKKALKHIIIDHHDSNQKLNEFSLVNPKAPSATSVIYNQLIKPLGIEVSPKTAECILTGLVSDTGAFKYIHDGDMAIETKDELITKYAKDNSFSVDSINEGFARNVSISSELENLRSSLIEEGLKNSILSEDNKKFNFVALTQENLKKFKVEDSVSDLKSSFNTLNTSLLENSDASVFFWELESDNEVKVSMRSKEINLCDFVKKYDGGGHPQAGGFTTKGAIADVMQDVLANLKKARF